MPTRNQSRKLAAKDSSSSSSAQIKEPDLRPVVGLKATGLPPPALPVKESVDFAGNNDLGRTVLGSSSPTNPTVTAATAPVSAGTPASAGVIAGALVSSAQPSQAVGSKRAPISKSCNPRVLEISNLKSGKLDVTSTSIATAIGLPPGPVSKLDFNDHVIANFFDADVVRNFLSTSITFEGNTVLEKSRQNVAIDESFSVSNGGRGAKASMGTALDKNGENVVLDPNCIGKELVAAGAGSGPILVANSLDNPSTTVANPLNNPSLMVANPVDNPSRMVANPVDNTSSVHTQNPPSGDFPPLNNLNNLNSRQIGTPVVSPTSYQTSVKATAPWVGLFKKNKALSDDTKMNPNLVGVTAERVVFDDVDLDDDEEEKRSLIGFFNGKFPDLKAVQKIVDDWDRKCTFHLHNIGWLVFTFEDVRDLDFVLKEGPYYCFGKPLVLKQMPEFFDFSDDAYSTAPVWIQLPNLPIRAWKKTALEKICSFLGTPLHIDLVTKDKKELSFARCLVDIDVSKELPEVVYCDLPRGKVLKQYVLFEKVPTFCTNCKKLGHDTEDCYANANGKPSIYVARSSKDKREKKQSGQGQATGKQGNVGKAGAHPQAGKGKSVGVDSGQVSGKVSEAPAASGQPAGRGDVSTDVAGAGDGFAEGGARTIHAIVTGQVTQCSALIGKNGNSGPSNAQGTGVISTNPFGALAAEKGSSWANEYEAEGAIITNKKNGRKK